MQPPARHPEEPDSAQSSAGEREPATVPATRPPMLVPRPVPAPSTRSAPEPSLAGGTKALPHRRPEDQLEMGCQLSRQDTCK